MTNSHFDSIGHCPIISGNEILLDRHLVAFFASRESSEEVVQRAVQWAESICQTDKVVISGFHSPLEKRVLDILLEHKHPVIIALGRALYKKMPPHLQSAFDEGRLLFISFRGYSRHSWKSAEIRNWKAAGMADEVFFYSIYKSKFVKHSALHNGSLW